MSKGLQRFVLLSPLRRITLDEVLQLICSGYRNSFHTVTRETPAYLALGIDPRPPTGLWSTRCFPDHQERIQILNTICEDLIHKAYLRSMQQFEQKQQYHVVDALEVGELVLLPIDRMEAAVHAIGYKGRKVIPKFPILYRIIQIFNQGRLAICHNLCATSAQCSVICEASIQDF